jgi:hypothetical protein
MNLRKTTVAALVLGAGVSVLSLVLLDRSHRSTPQKVESVMFRPLGGKPSSIPLQERHATALARFVEEFRDRSFETERFLGLGQGAFSVGSKELLWVEGSLVAPSRRGYRLYSNAQLKAAYKKYDSFVQSRSNVGPPELSVEEWSQVFREFEK